MVQASLRRQAVTVWDLHVGAEVDILGRMTTLQGTQVLQFPSLPST